MMVLEKCISRAWTTGSLFNRVLLSQANLSVSVLEMKHDFRGRALIDIMLGDGTNFMDGTLKVMMGYDNLIYGSKMATSGGIDGILPDDPRLTPALDRAKL